MESEFGARRLGSYFKTGRTLPGQLATLTWNHQRARYVYEGSIPFTEEQRLERERDFLDGTLPEEEWDIIFHAQLVRLLTEALLGHLAPWIPNWFDPLALELVPPAGLSPGRTE